MINQYPARNRDLSLSSGSAVCTTKWHSYHEVALLHRSGAGCAGRRSWKSTMARRFLQANLVDIDESDYSSLLDVIDKNDQFVPFVLA